MPNMAQTIIDYMSESDVQHLGDAINYFGILTTPREIIGQVPPAKYRWALQKLLYQNRLLFLNDFSIIIIKDYVYDYNEDNNDGTYSVWGGSTLNLLGYDLKKHKFLHNNEMIDIANLFYLPRDEWFAENVDSIEILHNNTLLKSQCNQWIFEFYGWWTDKNDDFVDKMGDGIDRDYLMFIKENSFGGKNKSFANMIEPFEKESQFDD